MKNCENPECSNVFEPTKTNPHQKYCGQRVCRNQMSIERNRKYKERVKMGIAAPAVIRVPFEVHKGRLLELLDTQPLLKENL